MPVRTHRLPLRDAATFSGSQSRITMIYRWRARWDAVRGAQMTEATRSAVPGDGQLVTVRNRPWVVAGVEASSVRADDPLADLSTPPQHLVSLVSVDSDARDEELRVIWELEPGAQVSESGALPDPSRGFDRPELLDAFLHAVRWGAVASADTRALQAPFRSGIQIEDYQLDPVARALRMPRVNLLIADDVGLGKTIEAGLVMQELLLRHRARTMLIVCPAGLTRQWHEEMRDKFGLEFRILDTELLKDLRRSQGLYANPWTHYPRLIVSIDWLKRERPLRLLREVLPGVPQYPRAFDLLVVDEVHTCAPSGSGGYAVDSLRTKAIKTLAPHCEHRLFLSATPHNGYPESFEALLELLDDHRFARGVRPTEEQKAKVMVRRLKRDLPPRWDGTPRFPERVLAAVPVAYGEDSRSAHALLSEYATSRRQRVGGAGQQTAEEFVITLLKKRLLSSPQAFAETIAVHRETMRRHSTDTFAQTEAKELQPRVLRPLFEQVDETAEDDKAFAQVSADALAAARRVAAPLNEKEEGLLEHLETWARTATRRPDDKFAAFRAWLEPIIRPHSSNPGLSSADGWSDERVIVFTEYRDTQDWLYERLINDASVPKERMAQLFGGQDEDERTHVKEVFQDDPANSPVRILLATDAASEGINLQNHCHRLLHWEIPWNPNRLEQRNGRIDRHGQSAPKVEVYHFVPEGWDEHGARMAEEADGSLEDELHFLSTAVRKVEQIREDLGSAGDVIAHQVEQKMLGKRTDWRGAETAIAQKSSRALLRIERDLRDRLGELSSALDGSRDALELTPETLEHVVRTALRLAHGRDLTEVAPPKGFDGRCFTLPELPGAWAAARNDGLRHPVTGKERPVTFDDERVTSKTNNVVLLHLGHRLVQMCLRLLRAELWKGGDGARLSRVTARIVPGDLLRAPAVVAHGRVVITGAAGVRLHEEVVLAGGRIEAGKLEPRPAEELRIWLDAAADEQPPQELQDQLAALWTQLGPDVARALAKTSDQTARKQAKTLDRRCTQEIEDMRAILTELRRNIESALDNRQWYEQLDILTVAEEREQARQDRNALERRYQQLPQLEAQESEALRRHYADPSPRHFAAAVTFLVPASLAHRR
ncbi:DISARM system SNF2-like helicase DrmD [Actinospica sp. MGRD01-02]|uniref:DISARM system SNF2-like helicase DrmD n=1 Tax=Actinospica acidithermotolerans TaxID=2828514 RepID=A0A941E779_9ACTN|nr:DISARM system SNF2-like helicase DrmD [Actinospica acidithermotolerans]MBR7824680.1 DISARM system SNF2-like helicase DrmD [Actinospica acidithermotolerans]